MSTLSGAPIAADLLIIFDGLAAICKYVASDLGLGTPGETGTYAYYSDTAMRKISGDGTTTNPGLSNAVLAYKMQPYLQTFKSNARYDTLFNRELSWITLLDQEIQSNLPFYTYSGATYQWSFATSTKRVLDMHLCRMNANHSSAPTAPSGTPTTTATTGGSIAAGTGRRIKLTLVGSADWMESLPGTASAQNAIAGANNAYTVGGLPAGDVPVGVTKLRIYSQLNGASGGDPYYYCMDYPVTAGVAWSTYSSITITMPDQDLRQDWQPPSYASCMATPESAFLLALSQATAGKNDGLMDFSSIAMLSPSNVTTNPVNGFTGFNPSSTALYASRTNNTSTFGTIRTTNDSAQGLQGYYGGYNLQARVTSTLDANATIANVVVTYLDASNPINTANTTVVGPITLTTAVDATAAIDIGASRWVRSVTNMSVTGMTTGTFVIEAIQPRTI